VSLWLTSYICSTIPALRKKTGMQEAFTIFSGLYTRRGRIEHKAEIGQK
jgi:hypothetical protein